jgi:predicted GNAT family acetyltransferase
LTNLKTHDRLYAEAVEKAKLKYANTSPEDLKRIQPFVREQIRLQGATHTLVAEAEIIYAKLEESRIRMVGPDC